jgi:hypothetical protein
VAGYLDVAGFKTYTVAPAEYVDIVEAAEPNWLEGQLEIWSRQIDAKLRKRYAAPFGEPVPITIKLWLSALVTWPLYLKRGIDPTDTMVSEVKEAHRDAWKEVCDAADQKEGRTDLPLRADTTATGITKGGPMSITEASPYTWTTVQRDAAELER